MPMGENVHIYINIQSHLLCLSPAWCKILICQNLPITAFKYQTSSWAYLIDHLTLVLALQASRMLLHPCTCLKASPSLTSASMKIRILTEQKGNLWNVRECLQRWNRVRNQSVKYVRKLLQLNSKMNQKHPVE